MDLEQHSEDFLQRSHLLKYGQKFVDTAVTEICNDLVLSKTFSSLFPQDNNQVSLIDTNETTVTHAHSDHEIHLNVESLNNFDDVVFEDDIDSCDIPMFFYQASVNFSDICCLPSCMYESL